MGRFKELYTFLQEYDIDTEYYLNEEARELYEADKLDLRAIEKLPVMEYIEYLDLSKVMEEEGV